MKIIEYTPKTHEDGTVIWEGTVRLKIPKQRERFRLLKEIKLKTNSKGEIDANLDEQLDYGEKMAKIVKDHVEEVNLTHKPSGESFKDLEDLEYYLEGTELTNELSSIILNGIRLGNA